MIWAVIIHGREFKVTRIVLAASLSLAVLITPAHAIYSVSDTGNWPKNWPTELESLREQATSIQGGLVELVTHHIPFDSQEQFEAAWPYLLRIKTKGAPIVLRSSPSEHWYFKKTVAGVLIHTPPDQSGHLGEPAGPISQQGKIRVRWMNTNYIELIVDGKIVDLNRIQFPEETLIIDLRFRGDD